MKRSRSARTATNLSVSVQRQVNMYALAASAAGVSLLALAEPAAARIVYTRTHHVIGKNRHYDIDFNHDGIPEVRIFNRTSHRISASVNIVGALPNRGESGGVEGGVHETWPGSVLEAALKRGARIGFGPVFYQRGVMVGQCAHGTHSSAPPCSSHPVNTLGTWANVKNRYIGVTFAVHGKTHYGWARLSVKLSRRPFKVTAILTGYAYETIPNKPIIAGKTKGRDEVGFEDPNATLNLNMPTRETAGLGLLALGAPGLWIWRRESVGATR
jgi:hypothetical protein